MRKFIKQKVYNDFQLKMKFIFVKLPATAFNFDILAHVN